MTSHGFHPMIRLIDVKVRITSTNLLTDHMWFPIGTPVGVVSGCGRCEFSCCHVHSDHH